jgi:hypothetical protein
MRQNLFQGKPVSSNVDQKLQKDTKFSHTNKLSDIQRAEKNCKKGLKLKKLISEKRQEFFWGFKKNSNSEVLVSK